ncbi:MAG: hypothetical protein ABI054_07580 [Planctomycetota bacterium]
MSPSLAIPEDELTRVGWNLAWTYERRASPPSGSGPKIVTDQERTVFLEFRDGHPAIATVGHRYMVRSIIPGKHDYLVAFKVLAEDEHGIFITWKILKTWPA